MEEIVDMMHCHFYALAGCDLESFHRMHPTMCMFFKNGMITNDTHLSVYLYS